MTDTQQSQVREIVTDFLKRNGQEKQQTLAYVDALVRVATKQIDSGEIPFEDWAERMKKP